MAQCIAEHVLQSTVSSSSSSSSMNWLAALSNLPVYHKPQPCAISYYRMSLVHPDRRRYQATNCKRSRWHSMRSMLTDIHQDRQVLHSQYFSQDYCLVDRVAERNSLQMFKLMNDNTTKKPSAFHLQLKIIPKWDKKKNTNRLPLQQICSFVSSLPKSTYMPHVWWI